MSSTHSSSRCANRAVAALTEATGDAIIREQSSLMDPPRSPTGGASAYMLHALRRAHTHDTESEDELSSAAASYASSSFAHHHHHGAAAAAPSYAWTSLDGLLRLRCTKDARASLYATWRSLQQPPPPPSVMDRLPAAVLYRVVDFLGHDSAAAVRLAATHRRTRLLLLPYARITSVSLAPTLIPRHALDDAVTMQSMRRFFSTHTRGQHVRALSLVEADYVDRLGPHGRAAYALHPHAELALGGCDAETNTTQAHDTTDAQTRATRTRLHAADGGVSVWRPAVVRVQRLWPLLAQMPFLTQLDVRGVTWAAPSLFLADLYLVAPQLRTLAMTEALFVRWTAGWWQRLPALERLVVGSRRESSRAVACLDSGEAVAGQGEEERGWGTRLGDEAVRASTKVGCESTVPAAPPVDVHLDCIAMLSTSSNNTHHYSSTNHNRSRRVNEGRLWSLTLWCPLTRIALRQLLTPTAPLTALTELLVNVQGNAEVSFVATDASSGAGAVAGGAAAASEAMDLKRSRSARRAAAPVDDSATEAITLPRLVALTVVDVQERPAVASELYQHMMRVAPNMRYFDVTNTTRPATVEKLKGRRRRAARGAGGVAVM